MALRRMSSRTSNGLSRNADSALEAAAGIAPKREMVLPFTPLAMSFDEVNYYVDMPAIKHDRRCFHVQVVRLIYTNSGLAVLALASNTGQKLWKWQRSDRNPSGKAETEGKTVEVKKPIIVKYGLNHVTYLIEQSAALAFYILSTIFIGSFVIIFLTTALRAALDFWVVKNVSGRILVGLRWWNETKEQGESTWKYECLDQELFSRRLTSSLTHESERVESHG